MQIASFLLALMAFQCCCCTRGCIALYIDDDDHHEDNFTSLNFLDDVYTTTKQYETTTDFPSTTTTVIPTRWPKPLVPVCCSPGLYYLHGDCVETDEDPWPTVDFPEIYTAELEPSNLTSDDFRRINYYPCTDGSFGINPAEDVHYFLENGTIYTENLTYPALITQNDYCLALMRNDENATYNTVIAVCLPKEDDVPKFFSVASLLSAIFLAATFFIYVVIADLQNIHGIIVRAYVAMLMTAYFALAIVQLGDQFVLEVVELCQALAYIVHFSFLASFFWLNVMCFDIWWTFGGFRSLHGSVKQRERKKFIMYSIYAWGCATLLTMITMVMDLVPGIPEYIIRPEFGKGSCWFESKAARALYFYGPMGITIVCNICLFILTAVKIIRHKKDTARQLKGSESRRHDDNKQWFNLYLKLFIVMGINWSMEIISWLFEDTLPKYVWYLTDLTNTLQGVIIFIIFVWKDKIRRLLMKRFGCEGDGLFRNSTSRSGCPTSSTSARTTCITGGAAPLQEKVNPYINSYNHGKSTVTDDSDCI